MAADLTLQVPRPWQVGQVREMTRLVRQRARGAGVQLKYELTLDEEAETFLAELMAAQALRSRWIDPLGSPDWQGPDVEPDWNVKLIRSKRPPWLCIRHEEDKPLRPGMRYLAVRRSSRVGFRIIGWLSGADILANPDWLVTDPAVIRRRKTPVGDGPTWFCPVDRLRPIPSAI